MLGLQCVINTASLFGILCLSFANGYSSAAQTFASANSTVESFKLFMQSRPVITKVIFDRQTLVGPPPGVPLPPSAIEAATNAQHFQAAWQPDAFFIRRLWDPKDADTLIGATSSTAGLLFAGKSEGKLWHIVNTNIYYSSQEANDDYVVQTVKNASDLLLTSLDFGAERMVPRSLKWNGDDFEALSDYGTKMHGNLEVSGGLPKRLSVTYEGKDFIYVSEFTYAGTERDRLPYGLPNTVITTFASGKRSIPQTREIFFSIECGNEDLDRSFFAPDRFMGAETQEIIATNKALYVIRNGVLGEKLRDLPDAASSRKWSRFGIVALLGAAFAAPAAFLFVRNRKNTTTNQRK